MVTDDDAPPDGGAGGNGDGDEGGDESPLPQAIVDSKSVEAMRTRPIPVNLS
jgi:hypothetical protein